MFHYTEKKITALWKKEVKGLGEDKATREKMLASAKEEFLEKGYMKASLRTCCTIVWFMGKWYNQDKSKVKEM